jgi:hypothetical protein
VRTQRCSSCVGQEQCDLHVSWIWSRTTTRRKVQCKYLTLAQKYDPLLQVNGNLPR